MNGRQSKAQREAALELRVLKSMHAFAEIAKDMNRRLSGVEERIRQLEYAEKKESA